MPMVLDAYHFLSVNRVTPNLCHNRRSVTSGCDFAKTQTKQFLVVLCYSVEVKSGIQVLILRCNEFLIAVFRGQAILVELHSYSPILFFSYLQV